MTAPTSTNTYTPGRAKSPQSSKDVTEEGSRSSASIPSNSSLQVVALDGMTIQAPQQNLSVAQLLQLLQMAHGSGSSYIKVPTPLVESLVAFMASQTDSLSSTTPSSCSVCASSSLPTSSTGPAKVFTIFPKLPLELRRMIWRTFLAIPQVISFDCGPTGLKYAGETSVKHTGPIGSRSTLTTVSKEARAEALRVQKKLTRTRAGTPIIYRSIEVDIIWISLQITELEENVEQEITDSLEAFMGPGFPAQIPRLAFNLQTWNLMITHWPQKFLHSIAIYGPEEIFVVVGGHSALRSRNVVFVKPRESPVATLPTRLLSSWAPVPNVPCTWDILEEVLIEHIRQASAEARKEREELIAIGMDPDSEEMKGTYGMVDSWRFKRVRLVEATTYDALDAS